MNSLVALSTVLLVAGQIPLSLETELPTGERAELSADVLLLENDAQQITARGHTLLRTERMTLRADELTYDQSTERANARGNVMFVSGSFAAIAEEITVDIQGEEATVKGGLFMQKRGVPTEALLAARTPDELRRIGQTPVLLSGTRIRRTGPDAFAVDDLTFTPCECSPGEPSWRVEANRADVTVGERAILSWPVVYVRSVPIFALPWLYLPLSERRSGLLVPQPTFSGLNGVIVNQPVFLTLGRSYDMTFTPGYYFGKSDTSRAILPQPDATAPVTVSEPPVRGIQGPRLLTEFRYVPNERTRGRATLGLLHDSRPRRDPRTVDFFREFPNGPRVDAARGLRGELSLEHIQDMGHGFHNRVDLALVSDGHYTRDLTADLIAREQEYLRSTAVVFHRSADRWVGLDVGFRQEMRDFANFSLLGSDRPPPGTGSVPAFPGLDPASVVQPRLLQRLPVVTLALPERRLTRTLTGSLRAEVSRLAPLGATYFDAGQDGRYVPTQSPPFFIAAPNLADPLQANLRDPLQADGRFNGSDLEARDRLDVAGRVGTSWALGRWVRATPSLGLRQDFFVGERTGNVAQRGYPLADLLLDTQLGRTYERPAPAPGAGPPVALRHVLTPSLQLRYVPFGWGRLLGPGATPGASPLPYDEIDAAVPRTGDGGVARFLHALVQVEQKLVVRRGEALQELVRLTLGQGLDLTPLAPGGRPGGAGESVVRDSFVQLTTTLGPWSFGALARFDPVAGRPTQTSASIAVSSPRGEHFYVQFNDLVVEGPDRLRRGIDALVGDPAPEAGRAEQLLAGARMALPAGLRLRYDALLEPLAEQRSPLAQQVFGLSYGPACDCWRLEGFAVLRRGRQPGDPPLPEFGFNLSITGFGNFGSGG